MVDVQTGEAQLAEGGLAFILPSYGGYVYSRAAAASFFANTPESLKPVLLHYDDSSPRYHHQNWEKFYCGLPGGRIWHHHFSRNGGLTRSWNTGLDLARKLGCRYAIAGNSDVLFPPGWEAGFRRHLDAGECHLMGPVTNAPGRTGGDGHRQDVKNYLADYVLDDSATAIAAVSSRLQQEYADKPAVLGDVNGFFMIAKVDTWWRGAFDSHHVFDPKYPMAGNEDELQIRWNQLGFKMGVSLSSFIFHYRSVTRGEKYRTRGACRMRRDSCNLR